MKIVGILVILLGIIDFAGSYADFDLWGGLVGLELPDLLWTYSAYIEMGVGYFLINLGSKEEALEAETEAE